MRSTRWRVPLSGRIVAANSHVHGGAIGMALTQPACGRRVLPQSRPLWGLPGHPYYRVLPVLHEPGPIGTDWVRSQRGIPVARGERLGVTSVYDNERLHTRVMGIMHVYIAPASRPPPLPGAGRAAVRFRGGRERSRGRPDRSCASSAAGRSG